MSGCPWYIDGSCVLREEAERIAYAEILASMPDVDVVIVVKAELENKIAQVMCRLACQNEAAMAKPQTRQQRRASERDAVKSSGRA